MSYSSSSKIVLEEGLAMWEHFIVQPKALMEIQENTVVVVISFREK